MKPKNPAPRRYDNVILVLQGGGALGAYQAGVFEGMTEAGYTPVKTLEAICGCPHVDIVHLINRRFSYTSFSKDYEFSRATVGQLWEAGLEDFRRTVAHPEWQKKPDPAEGIGVYDLTRNPPRKALGKA